MEREDIAQLLQPELMAGESLVWSGQPNPGAIFQPQDAMMIPFSLMWGGFAIFWEAGVLGFTGFGPRNGPHAIQYFMALWGIPFVLIGQYLIWGRFLYAGWRKRRIIYALTDKRAMVVDVSRGRSVTAAFLRQLPVIQKSVRRSGIGTLTFGNTPVSRRGASNLASLSGGLSSSVPIFLDIDDAETVYRTANELREKSLKAE